MAETIRFRGAVLRHFASPPQGETTPFVRSHWTVDFADPSNEVMGWKDPGDCGVTAADLVGDIASANVVVTPHDPELAKHQIQFDCHEAADFQLHTVKTEGGSKREVRFIIRSNVEGVAAMLENYRWRVGDQPAILQLSYVKQEQMTFDAGAGSDAETKANLARAAHGPITDDQKRAMFGEADGPCTSCNNEIPFEDEDHTTHVTGQPCARSAGSTLAAAATAGGTHQKRRGRSKPAPAEPAGDPESDGIQVEEEPIIN